MQLPLLKLSITLFGAMVCPPVPLELDELALLLEPLLDEPLPELLLLLLLLPPLLLLLLDELEPLPAPPVFPDVSAPKSGRQPPVEPTATQQRARTATLEARMPDTGRFIARLLDHGRQPGVNVAVR
jgi:hypothetical protein